MTKGILYGCRAGLAPALFLFACASPGLSSTQEALQPAPVPSASQRLLIEVHATSGVGWWSSATHEIDDPSRVQGSTARSDLVAASRSAQQSS